MVQRLLRTSIIMIKFQSNHSLFYVRQISKLLTLMKKLDTEFRRPNASKLDITFPKELTDNYLKILTNTYYLNIKKVTAKIRQEILDINRNIPPEDIKAICEGVYGEYLDNTRTEVLNYFKIPTVNDISPKLLVRIYVFSLPKDHPDKIGYHSHSKTLNQIEKNLSHGKIPEEFLDSDDVNFRDKPKDVRKYS